MNPDSTHLERWIRIWIEKYATGSKLKSSCEQGSCFHPSSPLSHPPPLPSFPSYRTLGTPDEDLWPGVTSLPDYKSTFPNWPRQKLQNVMKGVDPQGVDLLEVSCSKEITWKDSCSLFGEVVECVLSYCKPLRANTAKY